MSNGEGDDYLWDRSGQPDAAIQRLENLLSAFAHDDRRLGKRVLGPGPWRRRVVLAAGILVCVVSWWFLRGSESRETRETRETRASSETSEVKLLVVGEDRLLQENEWFDATSESRELRLTRSDTWLGEFSLDPGSRLQARRIGNDLAQLYLDNGRMNAFVYLDAHPRFVQTRTPATNCVDLGCKYTLSVNEAGDSVVEVTMGRVAFEDNGREVYVPHGATCRASKARGAGTPRYLDAPRALVRALDAFDAAHDQSPAERLRLCTTVLDAVPEQDLRHCLSVFHFLQDRDAGVVEAAREWLAAHVIPRSLRNDRARMKQYLEDNYWWK